MDEKWTKNGSKFVPNRAQNLSKMSYNEKNAKKSVDGNGFKVFKCPFVPQKITVFL